MRSPSFRTIFLIYMALLLGQIVFCFIVLFLLTQPDRPPLEDSSAYPFLGLLVVFLSAGAAWFLNKLRIDSLAKLRANFGGKLLHYQTSVILRSAVVESGNLFCLVLALLEGSLGPILYFCVGLGLFLFFRPKPDEMTQYYDLTTAEQARLLEDLRWRR